MRYRLIPGYAIILVILFVLAMPAAGQDVIGSDRPGFRVGLGLEYFTRAIVLNDEEQDILPEMTCLLASLIFEYEFEPGFSLTGHIGYSSSNFDSLTFRELPFSLEIDSDSGSLGGILLGAEVEKSVLGGTGFGVDIRGQFIASLGLDREWDLPGLAVEGSAKGKLNWMRACAGPVLTYKGWRGIVPFLYPRLDYIWGSYELKETVQELVGSEKPDIKGKSLFGLGLGSDFELSPSFHVRAEASLYPRPGGTDYSFLIRTLLAF
jgi:hypothetical protein